MNPRVYPVGYSAHGSDRYVSQLMRDDKTLMMDCRLWPQSRRMPEWQQSALVERWQDRYHFAGSYLGNAALRRNQQNRPKHIGDKPYRNEIEIVDPVRGINGLQYYLNPKRGHNLILLCTCWNFYNCHLSEVVRLLVERLPDVEIVMRDKPVCPNVYPFVPGVSLAGCEMADCGGVSLWTYYPQGNKEHPIALCEGHRQELQASLEVSHVL